MSNLLEGNMVCPGRPDLQIDELLLWAWTEQESHACNYQAELSYVSMVFFLVHRLKFYTSLFGGGKNLNPFYFLNREVRERLYHHWGVVWAEIQSLLSAWLLSRATLHPTFFMKKLVPRDCGCSSPFLFFFRKKAK